jgi:uncharacterized protein
LRACRSFLSKPRFPRLNGAFLLANIALALIRGYQSYLSPRKGFSCAYRVHTGGHSCSAFGHRAISRRGLVTGLVLLHRRLARCSWSHHQHQLRRSAYQSNFIDGAGDCGGCDAAACELPSFHAIGSDVGGCGCDVGAEVAAMCLPDACGESACGGTGWSREDERRARMARRRKGGEDQRQGAGRCEPEDASTDSE